MKISSLVKWIITILFSSLFFHIRLIAQFSTIDDTTTYQYTLLKTPHIKAGKVYLGLSPSAILNEYYAFQPNIEIGISNNMSIASEFGLILGNSNADKGDHFSGYRFRPSIRIYSNARNWSYDVFYNYRIAKIDDIDVTKISNKFFLDKTSGLGFGINYSEDIGNRIIASLGLGVGFGNGYVEYTPKHPVVSSGGGSGWGSGFELDGEIDFDIIKDFRPEKTGSYTHPITFFNIRMAYQLFK